MGAALRTRRLAIGLTQQQLATRAAVSLRTLREIEHGRVRPRDGSLRRLAAVLGMPDAPTGDDLWIGVLGPLVLRRGSTPVAVRSRKTVRLLALLAVHAPTFVDAAELAEALWDGQPPRNAPELVAAYASRLRKLLEPDRPPRAQHGLLIHQAGRYALRCTTTQLDRLHFGELVQQATAAQAAAQHSTALTLWSQAVECWRSRSLCDGDPALHAHPTVVALQQQYLDAVLHWADLAATTGQHGQAVPLLRELARAEPLHEALHARLILALAGAGQQAAALQVYTDIRERLRTDLGIDPGAALRTAQTRVLRQQYAIPQPTLSAAPTEPWRHMPRQLPAPPQVFTGRAMELADLEKIHDASTVVITAIDGMAGVGKTALAVQAAHQMVDRYPDGELFVDLHGYTQGVAPMEPGEALDRMLRSLGVPGERIPANVDERAGLYRSRLADQRMVILLDNAVTEAQVMPLLPGAPGCVVLVTSRRRLVGLDHTHTLSLDTLPLADAVALLRRSVSESWLAGQPPDLVAELVELCGRLPLAIRIAAARLRSHPTWDLAHLVQRLRDQQHRLVELAAGQRSVTAALDLSYQDLSTDLRRAYRLLGLHFGPDIDVYAAAALLDATLPDAGQLLEQLLEAHLLQEPVPARYRFHDLTRAHTATRDETEHERRTALDRLLDYYRHTAGAAMDAAYPYERERRPQVPPTRTPSPDLSKPAPALDWLDREMPNLLAAARYATQHDRPEHILHLSTILHRHLRTRGPHHVAAALHQQALTTARATGHQPAEIEALSGLGHIHRLQNQYEQATDHYRQTLQLARTSGDHTIEQNALTGLGRIHLVQGQYEQAIDDFQQALRLARTTGNRPDGPDALVGLGHVYRRQGRQELASDHYRQALRLARATGHRSSELDALTGLGHIHRTQSRYEQATDHYRQALQLARTTGNRTMEQNALAGLGDIHRMQRRYKQATDDYQRLLDLAQQTGDRNWQFEAWQGLGRIQHTTGHPDAALTHHQHALALATKLGQLDDQARAHDGLAHAHHALRQYKQARTHWQHALDILNRLGVNHTDDEETTVAAIRTHLTNVDHQAAPE